MVAVGHETERKSPKLGHCKGNDKGNYKGNYKATIRITIRITVRVTISFKGSIRVWSKDHQNGALNP